MCKFFIIKVVLVLCLKECSLKDILYKFIIEYDEKFWEYLRYLVLK